MKKLLVLGFAGLSFMSAAALHDADRTQLAKLQSEIKACRNEVKNLHAKEARLMEDHARQKSAAHVRYASSKEGRMRNIAR